MILFYVADKYSPRTQGTPDLQYVAEMGAIKRLRCGVIAQPPPTITWFKDDKPLQLSERVRNLNNNKTIKIKTVILRDQGNYTCIAENTLGKLNLTLELIVRKGRRDKIEKTNLNHKQITKTAGWRWGANTNLRMQQSSYKPQVSSSFCFGKIIDPVFSIYFLILTGTVWPPLNWRTKDDQCLLFNVCYFSLKEMKSNSLIELALEKFDQHRSWNGDNSSSSSYSHSK